MVIVTIIETAFTFSATMEAKMKSTLMQINDNARKRTYPFPEKSKRKALIPSFSIAAATLFIIWLFCIVPQAKDKVNSYMIKSQISVTTRAEKNREPKKKRLRLYVGESLITIQGSYFD